MSQSAYGKYDGFSTRNQNLGLPSFIKCAACLKNRQNTAFSNKQLLDYKARLSKSRSNAPLPRCRACIGGQVTELTCVNCGVTRGLGSFSKAQRSNPDGARCIDCIQEHLDTEPVLDDAIVEEANEMRSAYDTGTFDTTSIRQSLSGVTASTKSTASDIGIDDSQTNVSDTGSRDGVSSEYQHDSDEEDDNYGRVFVEKGRPSHPAGRASGDTFAHAHDASLRATTKTTGTAWDDIMAASGSLRAPRSSTQNSVTSGNNPGFVKLRAVAPTAEEKRAKELANEQRYKELEASRARFDDEDGDEDEDWEL